MVLPMPHKVDPAILLHASSPMDCAPWVSSQRPGAGRLVTANQRLGESQGAGAGTG